MPGYDVAVRNGYGNNIPVFPNNFSVQEIAQKIIDDKGYYDKLVNGVPQVAIRERGDDIGGFHLIINENTKVFKGVKLGAFYNYNHYSLESDYRQGKNRDLKSIEATCDGIFVPDIDKLKSDSDGNYYLERFNLPVEFGKIYLPEFEFFKRNQQEIEQEVNNIPLRKKQQEEERKRLEVEREKLEEEERQRVEKIKIEDLLNEQTKNVERLDELLKDLDKYIQMGQEISIETLQNIKDKLKFLYSQKDNLKDKKTINDLKSHFETSYKVAKTNPKFTEIIEDRMIVILKTFYEILGESKDSINTKISEIKTAGNDKKFAVEFDEKLTILNESITKLQTTFTNEKKLDFVQLETIEKISVDFEKQKKRINQKKLLERSKDSIESIYIEYIKLETKDGSAEKLLTRILKNFYLIFEKSEQQINESFEKIKEKESERKFEIEFTELLNKIGDSITQIQNSIEAKNSIDFTRLQIIENSLSTLKSKKKEIKNLKMVEDNKSKFESIFDDCRKQNLLSQNSEKLMLEILNKFYDILDFSDEQKKKIQEVRQKADEIREFENKVSEQNEAIKSISEKIRELEVIVENNEPVKIELLQTMEDSITQLAKQKDIIHDKTEIENMKVHFDAIFKDCKKRKDFLNSASLRMQEIEKGFNEIIGKKKNFLSVIFRK